MKILYVEDDARDADLTYRWLEQAAPDYRIQVTARISDAYRALQQRPLDFDLVLTDMRLPDGNGLDLLGHIRSQNLPLAVVVVTGSDDEEAVVAALRNGANDYIIKRSEYLADLPATLEAAVQHFREDVARLSRPVRLLYAEHHPADIDLVRRHLARYAPQFRVEAALSGSEMLACLPANNTQRCDYDLLLVDYRLPDMNALALLKEVRQFRKLDLPLVIVTGQGDAEIATQALKLGAADYLVKGPDYLRYLPTALENAHFRAELVREQRALRASEKRFRDLVEQSPFAIQLLAPSGQTLQVNPAWEKLWGEKAANLAGYNILQDTQLVEKGLMPFIAKGFAGIATEMPPVLYSTLKPGALSPRARWLRAYIYPVKDEQNRVREVTLMHEDVSKKKYVEDAIRLIAAGVSGSTGARFFQQLVTQLAILFDASSAYVGILDPAAPDSIKTLALYQDGATDGEQHYVMDDMPCAQVVGQRTRIFTSELHTEFPNAQLLQALHAESYIGTPLFDTGGRALGLIAVINSAPQPESAMLIDILEIFAARAAAEIQRLQAEERMRGMAYRDYLTGLANRAQLHASLSEAIENAQQGEFYGAAILIDLDHFKTINDALGHEVGDLVLRVVARIVEAVGGNSHCVARMGGDEFVVLMGKGGSREEAAATNARELAQSLVARLSAPIEIGNRVLNVGASVGIAVFPTANDSALDVLRRVDMALYRAKNRGRNNIQIFLPTMQAQADERLQLERGLREALKSGGLHLNFQPQLNAENALIGAEVLLRWNHPQLGSISAGVFIPVAEETGLIHLIGEWVLNEACARLATWQRDAVPFSTHLSVNVSAWQFSHPEFVAQVKRIVEGHAIPAQRLMLEITESALMTDLAETIHKLQELRAFGIKTSLDDFGTGYSSLSYLKNLPLDELKIDQSFIRELKPDASSPLVETIIAVARHLNLGIIAEGVETETQRAILLQLGCPNFQGYYFSKPLADTDFLDWLRARAG